MVRLYGVSDAGKLTKEPLTPTFASIVTAFEAILIETFEPPQNRRRGDDFTAVEYIQDIDPELREQELQTTLRRSNRSFDRPNDLLRSG